MSIKKFNLSENGSNKKAGRTPKLTPPLNETGFSGLKFIT